MTRPMSRFFKYSMLGLLALLGSVSLPRALQDARANGDTRALNMYNNHTRERINITYKRDGRYDRDALEKINWFLRDWRKNKSIEMDPQLLDLVWEVYRDAGGRSAIHIICGYRDENTNDMLRGRSASSGVAKHSQHSQGRAMDISIPGVPTERLREIGFLKQRGGVGYYRSSNFVHLDIANVRAWPRMNTQQLARLFPTGETLHLPSDGPPLQGYQTALARFGRDGKRGRSEDYTIASYAPRGLMSRSAPPEIQPDKAPVVAVVKAEPSLSDKLTPVLASLPEQKDGSRLAPSPVAVAALDLRPKKIAPKPSARPSDLSLPVEIASLETHKAMPAPRPLDLMPQTIAKAETSRVVQRAAAMTAPRYDTRQAAPFFVAGVASVKPNLTAPKFDMATKLMDAPVSAPQGFALRGVMKQAGLKPAFVQDTQKIAQL